MALQPPAQPAVQQQGQVPPLGLFTGLLEAVVGLGKQAMQGAAAPGATEPAMAPGQPAAAPPPE
eukprot:15475462-Alexandrium_andersonii.AAC.1